MPSSPRNSVARTDTSRQPAAIERRRKRNVNAPLAPALSRQHRIAALTRTIEAQIFPRLALAHRHDDVREPGLMPVFGAAELESFLALVLANDLQAAVVRVVQLADAGCSLVDICQVVLARAAWRLGEMWDDDLCSFVDVTAALGTLRLVIHRLRQACAPARVSPDASRRILLASLPGNLHSFGLQMVSEAFREAGWEVTVAAACAEADLIEMVRSEWFAVAGLSIALDRETGTLGRTILSIREASCNRPIGVLAGGPAFIRNPGLARLLGADGTAIDASQAVLLADDLRLDAGCLSGSLASLSRYEGVTASV
nr:cobalamin-dependent protein [uncultured Rhodopila sp.]